MDEHVTLTNRSSFGCTQHHVLCATSTCPETLTSPGGDARGRVREKRASDRFVTDLYTCHVYLAPGEVSSEGTGRTNLIVIRNLFG